MTRTPDDGLGLHVDMLDVDRLRDWARLLLEHGPDIGQWGSVPFVVSKMQTMATCLEKTIKDVGTLRAQVEAATSALAVSQRERDELRDWKDDALKSLAKWHALGDALQTVYPLTWGDDIPTRLRDRVLSSPASLSPVGPPDEEPRS